MKSRKSVLQAENLVGERAIDGGKENCRRKPKEKKREDEEEKGGGIK